MADLLKSYLKHYDVTLKDAAKISGISEDALLVANNGPFENVPVKILQALSMVTTQDAGKTLNELLAFEGNPIIKFIEDHPEIDGKLVSDIESPYYKKIPLSNDKGFCRYLHSKQYNNFNSRV